MDISVIIINYNNCNILKDCVDSLIHFTSGVSYEILIVDNNSDKCDPAEFLPDCENLTLIRNKENIGFSRANNQVLKIAKGNNILFLNNDTIFLENTLKGVFEFAKNFERPSIIGCKLLNKDGSNQISIGNFETLWSSISINLFLYKLFPHSKYFNKYYLNYLEFAEPREVDFVKGAFLFCNKKYVEQLKGFDEEFYFYGEEVDFCFRFKHEIGDVIYYPNTEIIHLGGATTDKNMWFKFENQTKGKIQFYQKHFNGLEKFLAIFFHYFGILLRIPVYLLGGIFSFNKSLLVKSWFYLRQLFVYPENNFRGK